jgi:predicted nuclease with RNAse H fold
VLRFVGIDLGASAMHCVVLDQSRRVLDGRVLTSAERGELEALTAGATSIAIDAPAALSTAPHRADPSLTPKFQTARCCELALGREHRVWVPWVTPVAGGAVPRWMEVGFQLYEELTAHGHAPIEVFPHAGFKLLAGGRPPNKATVAGARARVGLLAAQGVGAQWIHLWTHDALDAALAALLALGAHDGTAVPVGCGHDDSAIWIPNRPGVSARLAAPHDPGRSR